MEDGPEPFASGSLLGSRLEFSPVIEFTLDKCPKKVFGALVYY